MLETKGAQAASKKRREKSMKIIQAAVLVLVGALGAMLYLKVKSGPEAQSPAPQVSTVVAQPADVAGNPAAEPVEPARAPREKKHASRTIIASRQNSEP